LEFSAPRRIHVSEISSNLSKDNLSNSTFTPKGSFVPSTIISNLNSFAISFDGSFSFLGGLHPNPQRINVYANILNNGIIDIQINKK
jgi:hypothetical protein